MAAAGKHRGEPRGRVDAVVIGASAGGVEALSNLLSALPPTFRPTLLIVVHLPRGQPSLLVDIFSQKCALPLREALDKEPPQEGTVYFAPPDYHLLVDAGPLLALSADDPVCFSRPSVDVLFESAADVYGSKLLGLILTGASEDGAAGLDAIRRAGGLTAVQAPETAHAPQMPTAALRRGPVDFKLSLQGLSGLLSTLGDE